MFSSLTSNTARKRSRNEETRGRAGGASINRPSYIDKLIGAAFVVGVGFFSFLGGAVITHYHYPPYATLLQAKEALGALRDRYLTPSDPYFYVVDHDKTGVTVYDPKRTFDGYTFFTGYRDDEYKALLVDMEGKVLHEWRILFSQVWSDPPHVIHGSVDSQIAWHGAHLFPNGDVLFSFHGGNFPSGGGLVKLDKNSNVLWALARNTHHDFHVEEDGTIYAAAHNYKAEGIPDLQEVLRPPYVEDVVLKLSPEGEVLDELSILEAIYKSSYRGLLTATDGGDASAFDPTHLNNVETLPEAWAVKYPMFNQGDLLVSLRNMNTIAVVDPKTRLIKWAITGLFVRQHDPDILENGNILLFDNQGGAASYDQSQILEIDPMSHEIVWRYVGTEEKPFYSEIRGEQQPLPNGNILAIEPEDGRIFEITNGARPEVVWEYYNGLRPADGERRIGLVTLALRFEPEALTFVQSSATTQ